ncbi:MAG: N-6 DNA methylase [Armatimonadetes bacterium]|nr:N-6 DNA methylase [Armatimonadota bacterium]
MGDTGQAWRTQGLFSDHYLTERLPQPGAALWPDPAEADTVFDFARELLEKTEVGLRRGNEEDCEDRFITPLLQRLGFGFTHRRPIPDQRMSPDYLLYATQEAVDAAFEKGTREAYYAECLGILEAKRWGHNLSEEASGKGKAARGRSPHYQIRDYLTESDRLAWGVLTNGAKWRLYCREERASSFFEFDLARVLKQEGMTEAEARHQFRLFYALFRRAAFERTNGSRPLDEVRREALLFQQQVEKRLRAQVFDCVEILARGFLENQLNHLTRSEPHLSAIYENALIALYRILFVLNAEARDLLPRRPTNQRSHRYYHSYGLELIRSRLRDAEKREQYQDNGTFQLWERLNSLFRLINGEAATQSRGDKNEEMGVPRYNGGLFDPARHPFLEEKRVADQYLAEVLEMLCYRRDGSTLTAFDYAGLSERHLGSIYEGLLEHRLVIGEDGEPKLSNHRGERKAQGAYYTPQDWVEYIVRQSLEPLLAEIEQCLPARTDEEGVEPDDSFAEEVLKLNVCDPAMGSGHFLVEATSFLAEKIAAHPTTRPRPELNLDGSPRLKTDGSGEPLFTQEAKLAYWKRRVVEACIYGVDLNPLAVELAKLSLWLKTVDRVPLNFLDHHLRCGNSLLGTTLEALHTNPAGRRRSGARATGGLAVEFAEELGEAVRMAIQQIHAIEGVPTDTLQAAKDKEESWRRVDRELMPPFRRVADLWVGCWFGVELEWAAYYKALRDQGHASKLWEERRQAVEPVQPFHWELEFPEVFFDDQGARRADGGFDAVIGNPPWERIKLADNEFFAARSRAIAMAPRAADRKKLIAALPKTDPTLWAEYQAARQRAEQTLAFMHRSGFYPLMGRGDTNTYAVFAERAVGLIYSRGRVGLLVPSGIATDHTTREFFQKLVDEKRLAELLDFENRQGWFEDVHRSFKFSILLFSGEQSPQAEARCGFFLHRMEELADAERTFPLRPEDFRLFNPNTLTCPIFRRRRDVELTRKIYERAPVLVDKSKGEAGNPWGVRFSTMFHMTNDSHLFKTAEELEAAGFWPAEGNVYRKGSEQFLPLYEGKMVQMYDHRAASVVVNLENVHRPAHEKPTSAAEYAGPDYSPKPQFWVNAEAVNMALGNGRSKWLLGYKDVTAPTNVRTMIPAAIPVTAVGNTLCLILFGAGKPGAYLLANLSSFALDYAARQKVGGQHLNFFIVEQFPVLLPERYEEEFHGVRLAEFIRQRVLELSYSAYDLKPFAEELGYEGEPFPWDEERRLHLKCQMDALYFHLYGLTREEAAEVLETFPIVKRQDEERYGRFRTKELILGYYSAYAAGDMEAWVAG